MDENTTIYSSTLMSARAGVGYVYHEGSQVKVGIPHDLDHGARIEYRLVDVQNRFGSTQKEAIFLRVVP